MATRRAPTLTYFCHATLQEHPRPRAAEPLRRAAVAGSPPVAGLVFHLRNVLFDDTAWRRWLLQLLHRMGLYADYRVFFRCWEIEYLPAVRSGEMCYWEALNHYLAAVGMAAGQRMEVEAAGRLRRERFHGQIRPFPAVAQTLDRLHAAGVRLLAVETAAGEIEDPVQPLRDGGLEPYLTLVGPPAGLDFGETECRYREALQLLQLPPDRVAVVGQDPRDLHIAAMLGMWTIAFNAPHDAQADHHLVDFSLLPQLCGIELPGRRLAG